MYHYENSESLSVSESETETELDSSSEYDEEESIYSDDGDEILDHVEIMEEIHPIPMVNKNYYIGCYEYMPYDNSTLLLANKIHQKTFMKFNGLSLSKYFFWYSGVPFPKLPSIDILQLHITDDDVYTVVVKTFWIKIIQRTWKRVFKERQKYIELRKCLSVMREYEYGRQYSPIGVRYGSLKGLLSTI